MLLMLKLTILEKNNLRMLHRSMAFIILLFSFALGARAEVYYIIYYDDTSTSPATRHYVSIGENGTSIVDATSFSERCIWMRDNQLTAAVGGADKIEDGDSEETKYNTNNTDNAKFLQSYAIYGRYLYCNPTATEAAQGTSKNVTTTTSASNRWLKETSNDKDYLILYLRQYKHYVYYDTANEKWKLSSKADNYDTRAIVEVYQTTELPSPVLVSNVAANQNGGWTISLSSNAGSKIYYTIGDGIPSVGNNEYNAPFKVDAGATIKAMSYNATTGVVSHITEKVLPTSQVITLDDREDHTWSYYQEGCPISSPNPRNVKITYQGGGIEDAGNGNANAAVGIDDPETTFEYLKTLEKVDGKYPYTTIPNPFSKRPSKLVGDAPKQFYGFAGWKVANLTGCTINSADGNSTYAEGSTIPADQELTFSFTEDSENGYDINNEDYVSAVITLTAVWEEANVIRCSVSEIKANLYNTKLNNENSYEKNFIVVNSGASSTTSITNTNGKTNRAATVLMVEPDGSEDYRAGRYINPSSITLYNDLKFEYINLRNNSTTINANAHNLVLGRGITHPYHINQMNASVIRGLNQTKDTSLDYLLRIESGIYNTLYFVSTSKTCRGQGKRIRCILGSDYDRAMNDDTRLKILGQATMGSGMIFSNNTFESSSFHAIVKSGTFNANQTSAGSGSASQSFYISMSSDPTNAGSRTLIIEGGVFWNIAGGVDSNEDILTSGEDGYNETSVYIRMKGGTVKGCIYGGGAYAEGYGNRKLVFTGGTVGGWIAAGCNGTQTSGGKTYGRSYVYVGGITQVTKADNNEINGAAKGQVFGAGKGYANTSGTSGEMTYGTTVVVADNASIAGDVYGGGYYGYAQEGSSNVYVLGGTIGGDVYGGSNMKGGAPTNIKIAGGLVKGDVYGGSNTQGEIASTSITMTGGTVGSNNKGGNIFGGGNQAPVTGNTNVTITGGAVKRNVYGGGNNAAVSGTTNVVIGQ